MKTPPTLPVRKEPTCQITLAQMGALYPMLAAGHATYKVVNREMEDAIEAWMAICNLMADKIKEERCQEQK